MDKTFAETRGQPAHDWRKTIERGKRGEILIDETLADLGFAFHVNIVAGRWDAAEKTLASIEARSAVLISEQLAALKANQEGRR